MNWSDLTWVHVLVLGGIGLALGVVLGAGLRHVWGLYREHAAENEARRIREQAEQDARQLRADMKLQAKEEILKERERMGQELAADRNELKQIERRLLKREDALDQKLEGLTRKESNLEEAQRKLTAREHELQERYAAVNETLQKQEEKLLEISGYNRETAEAEILRRVEEDLEHEIGQRVQRAEERCREEAEARARDILGMAVQRLAVDYTTQSVVSTVELPNDEMKGRIIGREGRNIRAFEKTTGVDVIVDDTPGVVVLSGFDPIRRETARLALDKLVADGRIHPARIEEVVSKTQEDMEKELMEAGRAVAAEVDVRNLKPKELFLLGRLKYRTSYGQNVLDHAREVAFLSGMIAMQLKLDEDLARRAGLLHDIGKAVDHEEEGTHPEIGANLARLCEESPEVVNAIAAHHEGNEAPRSLYATIVQIADAISASRPGVRRESLEKYIKRLEKLENIASAHVGIEKAYAIQAGREVRVIAKPDKLSDKEAHRICREIAQEIEQELSYPGEVKITLIRENRFVEYAR